MATKRYAVADGSLKGGGENTSAIGYYQLNIQDVSEVAANTARACATCSRLNRGGQALGVYVAINFVH